ncbi:MAG: hypothetical protein IJ173_01915 [Kiritimatiellae bacterium]|nr:hypothetical protein [Kiritimatiellia bacterium]
MDILCPHCGTEYEIDEFELGEHVTCQICGKKFFAAVGNCNRASSKTSPKLPFGCSTLHGSYICTNCAEITSSPTIVNGTLIGCASLCVIPVALLASLIFTPLVGIALSLFFLVGGIVSIATGRSMFCPKCQKRNTLISTTSPQGIRLLKETQQNNVLQRPRHEASQMATNERLKELRRLLDSGLINETEYANQRSRILDNI